MYGVSPKRYSTLISKTKAHIILGTLELQLNLVAKDGVLWVFSTKEEY